MSLPQTKQGSGSGHAEGLADVRLIVDPASMALAMDIRYEVFITEQGYDPDIEIDDPLDPLSVHFLAYDGLSPAGSVRVSSEGQLGRLAVLRPNRGRGLAPALCRAAHAHARGVGLREVWLEAQADSARGVDCRAFYARMGYALAGEEFVKAGTRHQRMILDLTETRTPGRVEPAPSPSLTIGGALSEAKAKAKARSAESGPETMPEPKPESESERKQAAFQAAVQRAKRALAAQHTAQIQGRQ